MSKVKLPPGYSPSEDEDYMCAMHIEYFRQQLLSRLKDIYDNCQYENVDLSYHEQDQLDQSIIDNYNELKVSCNNQKYSQLQSIKRALQKIDTKDYGYCEVTQEAIGINRIMANPTARYCIEVQEALEKQKNLQYSRNKRVS